MTRRDGNQGAQDAAAEDRDGPQPSPPPQGDARPQDQAAPQATPDERLAAKEQECRDLVDKLKRVAADFSNYQKRSERRLADERTEAVRAFVLDLLPVIDNFERALAAAGESQEFHALFDGIRLAHDQLLVALEKHGITPIEADGTAFDPRHHEAVAHLPSHEHPEGHVSDVVQRGYRFGDRTLRASRVAVSSGKPPAEDAEKASEEADGEVNPRAEA